MENKEGHQQLRQILPTRVTTESEDKSEPDPQQTPRAPKRRAPITNVACQGCRKRKTKCNGAKPRCTNCARRGFSVCEYDAEGTQSNKISIYKSRIEQQESRIAELEAELRILKDECAARRRESSISSRHSWTHGGVPTRLPPLTSSGSSASASASSSDLVLSPMRLPDEDLRNQQSNLSQASGHFAQMGLTNRPTMHKDNSEYYNDLESENQRLRELGPVLTGLEDRGVATDIAIKIRDYGLTDPLLAEISTLIADGRRNLRQSSHTQAHMQTHTPNQMKSPLRQPPSLPALSSLDLPPLSISSLDKGHHDHSYPAASLQNGRSIWR